MEQFVKDQIVWGAKVLPLNLLRSAFIPSESEETKALRKKGFICGVCHPNGSYEQITKANIGWVRFDIPFPFDKQGNIRQSYRDFKQKCAAYQRNGLKVMAVTPYPDDYIENGMDIRTKQGEQKVRETARFLIREFQGLVDGFQITNEMGMPRFTLPLTMEEAVKFIGVQLEEMYPLREEILIGYNSAGPQADLHVKMKPYLPYCDYVGVDIYMGCFFFGCMWMFDALINFLWALTGKPILLQEFGYISDGKPKTKKQKAEILSRYGAKSKKDAKKHIEEFVEQLPPTLKAYTKRLCHNETSRYYNFLFHSDVHDHLFCELGRTVVIPGYEHTPLGQAKFYRDIMSRFYENRHVCGAFIYCYQDSEHCYVCGQSDCPVETRWGLVDMKGEPKPSYFAVQKALANFKVLCEGENRD